MVGLLVLFLTGFAVYYLIRHPVITFKVIAAILGCITLGMIVYGALFYWIISV